MHFREQMDTSKPAGKMVFTVLGDGRARAQPDREAGESGLTQCASKMPARKQLLLHVDRASAGGELRLIKQDF